MVKQKTRQVWEERIAAFRASGQTAVAWCKDNQVNRRQLYSWMRKINVSPVPAAPKAKWVTVQADKQLTAETESTLIVKIGPASIEVKPGFNSVLLRDIVQTLEALC